jgi:hypothetical protein
MLYKMVLLVKHRDLPECVEKMRVEQSLHALLLCRVLQQQQISSIGEMEAVEVKNSYKL